ncbi:tetratricopeptide repeat protein [Novipirellula artificiosorum]|uniref:Tetratricopeptide repeat protein n=1 Tax=Novipirellula artificiosorum TaxID=2528016 RepID=A0A5C6DLL7_9BACT|nr:tetratricopeptide repeat protein [Novipirellula artificiosorum]TWU37075.1 Tetratricopeptide repeat protein [Novipirellula artificiosorum]
MLMEPLCFVPTACQAEVTSVATFTEESLINDKKAELAAVQEKVNQRDDAAARAELQRLSKTGINYSDPEVMLAQMMLQAGRNVEARQVLEKLSGQHPRRFDVHFAFAQIAIGEKRWFDAYSHAELAEIAGFPANWTEAHRESMIRKMAMVKAAACEGRFAWSDAKKTYELLTKQWGKLPEVSAGLGRCEFHLGNDEIALQHFEAFYEETPGADLPEMMVAKLFEAAQQVDQTEAYFQRAIEREKRANSGEQTTNKASRAYVRWLIWSNRPAEARRLLRSLPKGTTDAEKAETDYVSALIARMQGRFDEARDILSRLHQADPASFTIGNQLALVLVEDSDEARRFRALQIAQANTRNHSEFAEAWSTLGWVQFRLGDVTQAEKSLSVALKNGVVERDTAYFLSKIKEKLGQDEVASQLAEASKNANGPTFYLQEELSKK